MKHHILARRQRWREAEYTLTNTVKIALNRDREVALHEQITEQIVFQITTGKLKGGEELPSVRALAHRLKIHHNTVSRAYQMLVKRRWLTRRRGARLHVSTAIARPRHDLDSLIDQAIRRARAMGFTVKELEERAIERLSMEAPRYLLVVEEETGLREIIQLELSRTCKTRIESCEPDTLAKRVELATDAIVVGAENVIGRFDHDKFKARLWAPLIFNSADAHLDAIRELNGEGIVAVASYSRTFLKTARGLIKGMLTERHCYQEFLFPLPEPGDFRTVDMLFCDSVTAKQVRCKNKKHYQLIAAEYVAMLSEWLVAPRLVDRRVRQKKKS